MDGGAEEVDKGGKRGSQLNANQQRALKQPRHVS